MNFSKKLIQLRSFFSALTSKPAAIQAATFLSFATAAVVILGVGSYSFFTIKDLIHRNRWVQHTHEVIEDLYQLENLISQSQGTERDYFMTNQDYYLKQQEGFWGAQEELFRRLRALTADNSVQKLNLVQAEKLATEEQKSWNEAYSLYKLNGLGAIQARLRSDEAKRRQ